MTAGAARPARPPVAVVGIGCRFPGGIGNAADFWSFLSNGEDAIGEIPGDRIDIGHFFDARPAIPGRMMSRWGGYLDGIDTFDADFFGISPREAERLDPQQRLMLELAWETFEDAGQDLAALNGRRCGVYVGQWLSDFEARLFGDPEAVDFLMTTGSGRYASSGRISYALGLRGPSMTIDTACSSSLVAVHLAVQSIRSGESEMALAGGVNIILQPHVSVAYSQSRMMAPDGRCKFGDASGDGYVRSEGAGLVLLKDLERALEDGDRIYAVVRGSATNNDGRSSGSMGTPSRIGQEELLRTAYQDADVSPAGVGYVEAHGTGTRAGDPVELGALASVLGEARQPSQRGYVGSVKTNFGHTEGAAGAAGFIKAVLALHHDAIPPSLHCRELNPAIPWTDMPLAIPQAMVAWPELGGGRIAGVSAFGIAGANAHVVLEAAPVRDAGPGREGAHAGSAGRPALLPLSAKSPTALRTLAGRYADLLEASPAPLLHDVCFGAATRRTPLAHRAVFIAEDAVAMADALRRYASGDAADCEGVVYSDSPPKMAFVFPGQGAQWIGMARQLVAREPVFRAELERCDAIARRHVGWSIIGQLHAEPADGDFRLDRIDVIQPVLVALAIAYAALWRSLGVEPDAVVGHSMGEVGAACVAGVLDLEQAMKVICRRSALMQRKSGMGAMAMVELSMAQARARLAGREDRIVVAVSNGPRSSVVSGEPEAVAALIAELEREEIFCRLVKVDVASHSPQMESVAADLVSELQGLVPGDATVRLYSTVFGRQAAAAELGASYWGDNLRRPVLFKDAVAGMIADGTATFIELGPHPVLLPSVQQTAQSLDREILTIECGQRERPEQEAIIRGLGALWANGARIDWHKVFPVGARFLALPSYPWQRERHWIDLASTTDSRRVRLSEAAGTGAGAHPLLGSGVEIVGERSGMLWELRLNLARMPHLAEHRLHGAPVLAASVYVELALAAARACGGTDTVAIRSMTFDQPFYPKPDIDLRLQFQALPADEGTALGWYSQVDGTWVRHASGRLEFPGSPAPGETCFTENLRGIEGSGESAGVVDAAGLYSALEAQGAAFGPLLRGIHCARVQDGFAVADLVVPHGNSPSNGKYVFRPEALDACFQLAVILAGGESLWVPSSIELMQCLEADEQPIRVAARSRGAAPGGVLIVDIVLLGTQRPLMEIRGLKLEPLARDTPRDPRQWLFKPMWRPQPLPAASTRDRCWLVIADQTGLGPELVARLKPAGSPVLLLPAGEVMDGAAVATLLHEAAHAAPGRPIEVVYLRGLDAQDPSTAGDESLDQTVQLIQALCRFETAARRCWLVSRGACAIQGDDPDSLAPAQASSWGLGAAAAAEHPSLWGGCLDLDPEATTGECAAWLVDELLATSGGDAAMRGGHRLIQSLSEVDASMAKRPSRFRCDATYLITGGLGGIGIEVARWMIERGARHLAILGRTPLPSRPQWSDLDDAAQPSRMISAVRRLEGLGASVQYAAVDLSEAGQLKAFLEAHRSECRPEIRGVFHAAGAIDDRLIEDLDIASMRRVLAGKAMGAWHLDQLLPELDHFVLFSSVAGLLAQPGQASYAAANAFLDRLAHGRKGRGQPAISVGWGVWQGVGFAATAGGAQASSHLERLGIGTIPVASGLGALDLLLQLGEPQVTVLPIDRTGLRDAMTDSMLGQGPRTLLGGLLAAQAPQGTVDAVEQESFAALLALQEPSSQRKLLEERLAKQACAVLRLGAGRIDPKSSLGGYGLNSLMAMELRNRIEADLDIPLSATALWNYPSIVALAAHLQGRMFPRGDIETEVATDDVEVLGAPDVQLALEEVQSLSDADALAELWGHRIPVRSRP